MPKLKKYEYYKPVNQFYSVSVHSILVSIQKSLRTSYGESNINDVKSKKQISNIHYLAIYLEFDVSDFGIFKLNLQLA